MKKREENYLPRPCLRKKSKGKGEEGSKERQRRKKKKNSRLEKTYKFPDKAASKTYIYPPDTAWLFHI